jgi:hypothetical protein
MNQRLSMILIYLKRNNIIIIFYYREKINNNVYIFLLYCLYVVLINDKSLMILAFILLNNLVNVITNVPVFVPAIEQVIVPRKVKKIGLTIPFYYCNNKYRYETTKKIFAHYLSVKHCLNKLCRPNYFMCGFRRRYFPRFIFGIRVFVS